MQEERQLIQLSRCFLSQVPIAFILFFIAAWGLSSNVSKEKKLDPYSNHTPTTAAKLSRMDYPGMIAFTLTMSTFLLALSLGGRRFPWDHVVILLLGAVCVASGILFVLIEGLVAKEPLIPLRLLRSNGVGVFCLVQILSFIGRWSVGMVLATLNGVDTAHSSSSLPTLPLTSYGLRTLAILSLLHILSPQP